MQTWAFNTTIYIHIENSDSTILFLIILIGIISIW